MSIGPTKLPTTLRCPGCHAALNAVSHVNTDRGPIDGDHTVCSSCATVMRFAEGVTALVAVPPAEWLWLPTPERHEVRDAIRQVKAFQAWKAKKDRDAGRVAH